MTMERLLSAPIGTTHSRRPGPKQTSVQLLCTHDDPSRAKVFGQHAERLDDVEDRPCLRPIRGLRRARQADGSVAEPSPLKAIPFLDDVLTAFGRPLVRRAPAQR